MHSEKKWSSIKPQVFHKASGLLNVFRGLLWKTFYKALKDLSDALRKAFRMRLKGLLNAF